MSSIGRCYQALAAVGVAASLLLVAAPAMAAQAHAPRPSVRSLSASTTVLAAPGGPVKLVASVSHATTCTFSSSPRVKGLPAHVSCRKGRATETVRLPKNSLAGTSAYRLTVTASGKGGTSAPRHVTVRVLPAKPSALLSTAPPGLVSTGGTATLTAAVTRATSCQLSASPSVAGLPATFACVAGISPVTIQRTVTLPGLTGSTAQAYTFSLKVSGPGGTTQSAATETVWPPMTFSSPASAGVSSFTDVSCPTTKFCAATDTAGGTALYNGATWTVQAPITPSGVALVSVSCTSPKFCMAVDDQDGEYGSGTYLWNGQYWAAGGLPGNYLTSVSCVSATFCMALGNLNTGVFASAWNGKSWGTQTQIDSPPASVQVSCATTTFCAAVDANGDAMTFNGASWSSPDPIDPGVVQPLATVSCPSASFCTAMDGFGQAFTYNGTTWSGPVGVENSAGVTSVSCPSATFCVAADLTGDVVTDYNGTWSAPDNIDPQSDSNFYGFSGISCPAVSFCAAVDERGNVALGAG
jgi:hypothetical protein